MAPQLCLGTAQFGLPYGITNTAGQVPEEEVRKILKLASQEGIQFLDTAQAYGNAEAVLGRAMPDSHAFRVISKLPAQDKLFFTAEDYSEWEDAFRRSFSRLRQHCIDAFLLHSPSDLQKPGGDYLKHWLLSLRDRGFVRRLGISIYTVNDLEGVPSELLDLVQLPLSLYDQRLLANGAISRLYSQGCRIHARSIYLQGLMLKSSSEWPRWISPHERNHHVRLEQVCSERGRSLLDAAISFIQAQSYLEAAVVGVCSLRELEELMSQWGSESLWPNGEWRNWAIAGGDNSRSACIIDPRSWPS
jgi:aryl-alcohol dehydrogenase-like predicted oxidoreductase